MTPLSEYALAYVAEMAKLLLRREAAGELSMEEESEAATALNDLHVECSDEENVLIERLVARLSGKDTLSFDDLEHVLGVDLLPANHGREYAIIASIDALREFRTPGTVTRSK